MLHNSLVIGSRVLLGEVLLKIQISDTQTVDVVSHIFWNFQKAIFLANILMLAIVGHIEPKRHTRIFCTPAFASPPPFHTRQRNTQCREPDMKSGNQMRPE